MQLVLNNVAAGYDGRLVVGDVDLAVAPRDFVGIIGRNGSGKSTLLKVMAGLLSPRSGSVAVGGERLDALPRSELARRLALLPQHPVAPPETTVAQLVAFGRMPHVRWYRRWSAEDQRIVGVALERCGLSQWAERPIGQLSGGERQRAWIAMALAQQTPLLLLDEPLSFLDISHQLEVMDLLRDLHQEGGLSIVIVMHDINLAGRYCERLVSLRGGRVVHDGPVEAVLTDRHLADVFHVHARVERDGFDGRLACRFYGACDFGAKRAARVQQTEPIMSVTSPAGDNAAHQK
jgi:iron complex transport system ATP-binding protein